MAITGPAEGEPSKVGVAITDVITGLYAAVALLTGLYARRSGDANRAGHAFDLSLLDCTLASLVNVAQSCLVTGRNPERFGNGHPTIVPYQTFATQDGGRLMLAVGNDAQFQRLCGVVQRPEWAVDVRFADNPSRVAHRRELIEPLEAIFQTEPLEEWSRRLTAADVPFGPVQPLGEALSLAQVEARRMVVEIDAGGEPLKLLGSPLKIDGCSLPSPSAPPEVGEHTEQVLRDVLGYDADRIAALRASGACG
jgi:crotonobetainyl-CoA:carnitine CoA-transferase CaiB-like acyl-CoA transferase